MYIKSEEDPGYLLFPKKRRRSLICLAIIHMIGKWYSNRLREHFLAIQYTTQYTIPSIHRLYIRYYKLELLFEGENIKPDRILLSIRLLGFQ